MLEQWFAEAKPQTSAEDLDQAVGRLERPEELVETPEDRPEEIGP